METIKNLSAKLANGETSAVALAQDSLAKIESTKNLNAYISVLNERALAKAAESDKRRAEGKSLGALDGIPVAVKDNMCLEGTRTTAASKILDNFVDSVNAVECALAAQQGGAAAVAVHGRTREQYYSGKADWSIIRDVKEALNIPVIGNGDVVDGESAQRMFEETGCDGVMVARAAQGNPFLFREIKSFFEEGKACDRPTPQEIYDTVIRHADLQLKYKGEYIGIREMRKHVSWYTFGMPGSAKFRNEINQMTDMDSLKKACARVMLGD